MMQGRIFLDICLSIVPENDIPKANPTVKKNLRDASTEDDQQPDKDTYDIENSLHNTDIQERQNETLAFIG